ncbi:MAG: hypothetical protein DLM58_12365 [Pseudonocardiales bacterium]|nr:MAG: hypothetical protein DLM58_12365 [Pseudonocardiales bacterium]
MPLTEIRRAFERLIVECVSNSEACRVVGINRKAGTRWRHGRDIPATGRRTLHYPPVISTGPHPAFVVSAWSCGPGR